jgi:tetratricopeptide (TPR) repeat protein
MRGPLEQLQEVEQLRLQGKFDKAETIGVALTRKHPYYLAGLYTLGLVYLDRKNHERALDCLIRALMCDPKNWKTLTALGLVYLRLRAYELAKDCLQRALYFKPHDASILTSLGEVFREDRDDEAAVGAYQAALAIDPSLETAEVGLSACLLNRGRYPEAAEVLRKAYARGHRSLNILHQLAGLPRSLAGLDPLEELASLRPQAEKASADYKTDFMFGYGAALDAAGRFDEAWPILVAANRAVAPHHRQTLLSEIEQRESALSKMLKAGLNPIEPLQSHIPISLYILGPSRSGKTSLENLLRGIDGFKPGCEAPIVERALQLTWQSAGLPAGKNLDELPASMVPAFRNHYIEELRGRAGTGRVVTITVADRIRDILLMSRIVPNVRVALVRRNEDDNALRIFMTKYSRGNSYAYSMESIRAYLDWYRKMQDVVSEKMSAAACLLSYEDMVADPRAAIVTAIELCGISATSNAHPAVHDDRNCSRAYAHMIHGG